VRAIKTTTISILTLGLLAGSAVGVTAQDDDIAPASVTGTATFPDEIGGGSRAWEDGALRYRDLRFTSAWEASDPRLSGAVSLSANRDQYERQQMEVVSATAVVENDGGRWSGTGTFLGGADLGETLTMVMQGEDAYEGLTAYVVMDLGAQTLAASIFPGEMPPFPEPPAE
jgi:hypothetical protein